MANFENAVGVVNDWFNSINMGDADRVSLETDYSNIVDFGRQIVKDTTVFDDNFAKTWGSLIDKVGNTDFITGKHVSVAPDIWRTGAEWSSMSELVYVDTEDAENGYKFDMIGKGDTVYKESDPTDYIKYVFAERLPKVTAEYYNSKVHYSDVYTETYDQIKNSFRSKADFNKFWNSVQTVRNNKLAAWRDNFAYAVLDAAILKGAIDNKVTAWGTTGSNIDGAVIANMNDIIDDMELYSNRYSTYATSTTPSDLCVCINSKLYNAYRASLAEVKNPDFLNIPFENLKRLPYFQYTSGSRDTVEGVVDGKHVKVENIVAVLYNRYAIGCHDENKTTDFQKLVNKGINYFTDFDAAYRVNTNMPFLIITKNGTSDITITNAE